MDGRLIIISAPSGAGKSTIAAFLLETRKDLEFSVSATTRPIRGIESNGREYYFMSADEFRERVKNDEFVEWEEVYADQFYGTLKSEIERIWSAGKHVLFDVDVKGGISLKRIYSDKALAVFIMPPTIGDLEKRLINRATDTPDKIRMRVNKAAEEMKSAREFDHVIINDDLEKAKNECLAFVTRFLNG